MQLRINDKPVGKGHAWDPSTWELREDDHKFKASLGCIKWIKHVRTIVSIQ
jgi:hypothetical protein